eukprot:CAMPEP_0118945272 /NCGR_PEP_ID=MMETSP1169-20130426/41926_1 /TAXON_ID=36882 /ORGANISM="Pyramimonas obovata, Strain CCMP722" /LENGTH=231 /DNA_ID=CAMNT_0006890949 /DNA_START=98 /DNA_END=790 /DNA_ORIENTATION=+
MAHSATNFADDRDGSVRFCGTVHTGFEFAVQLELERKLDVLDGKPVFGVGRVFFSVRQLSSDTLTKLSKLRSVIYLVVVCSSVDDFKPTKEGLAVLRPSILPGGIEAWELAKRVWVKWQTVVEGKDLNDPSISRARYRVSPKRGGVHDFTSGDLSYALGCNIRDELHWEASLREYDMEVRAYLHFSSFYAAIALNTVPLWEVNLAGSPKAASDEAPPGGELAPARALTHAS